MGPVNSRKEAIQAYKERKTPRGIFAVRCQPTGGVWIESALDLGAAENRTWAALRLGDVQLNPALAAQFQEHGRDVFTFEVLEKLDDDVADFALRDLLKEKKRFWIERLEAHKVYRG
jgi:hypothetical protein